MNSVDESQVDRRRVGRRGGYPDGRRETADASTRPLGKQAVPPSRGNGRLWVHIGTLAVEADSDRGESHDDWL